MEISGKITTNKKLYGKHTPPGNLGEIQFGKKGKSTEMRPAQPGQEEAAGLNGLDSDILQRNYGKDIPNDSLKLEVKLERAEEKLKRLKEEQELNELFGINDPKTTERLKKTQERLEKEIQTHREAYRKQGLSYQITDTLSQANKAIKEKTAAAVEFAARLLPSAKEREKLKYARMLNQQLSAEMNKKGYVQPIRIQSLLLQAEKLKGTKV